MKATAIAHPIQGLIKYHGMTDKDLRLPYHDSISVCMQELSTITTVENAKEKDVFFINNQKPDEIERRRMEYVINRIRELSGKNYNVKVVSKNVIGDTKYSYKMAKGLGFSSSGGAALAAATAKAFEEDWLLEDYKKLSTIARRLAGSATRSVAGGFSKWYCSQKDEESYAVKLADKKDFPNFRMIVYPIPSREGVKTEQLHQEVETSPLFQGRCAYVGKALIEMENAIKNRDINEIGWIAERDSLNLHAVSITGVSDENVLPTILWEPESIAIFKKIRELRKGVEPSQVEKNKGLHAYASWDTGPATFINTSKKYVERIKAELNIVVPGINPIICSVGDEVKLTNKHLF